MTSLTIPHYPMGIRKVFRSFATRQKDFRCNAQFLSGYFFRIGAIIGEWLLFIIAIRHPRYLKISIYKRLQNLMKRQKG